MGRTCAICGRSIGKNILCSKHYKEYYFDKDGNKIKPPYWLRELIRIQKNYDYGLINDEITYTDLGLDINGEPLFYT